MRRFDIGLSQDLPPSSRWFHSPAALVIVRALIFLMYLWLDEPGWIQSLLQAAYRAARVLRQTNAYASSRFAQIL